MNIDKHPLVLLAMLIAGKSLRIAKKEWPIGQIGFHPAKDANGRDCLLVQLYDSPTTSAPQPFSLDDLTASAGKLQDILAQANQTIATASPHTCESPSCKLHDCITALITKGKYSAIELLAVSTHPEKSGHYLATVAVPNLQILCSATGDTPITAIAAACERLPLVANMADNIRKHMTDPTDE